MVLSREIVKFPKANIQSLENDVTGVAKNEIEDKEVAVIEIPINLLDVFGLRNFLFNFPNKQNETIIAK